VLTRISGEPRTAISHRSIESCAGLRVLQNSYIEKRTLDFHASQLFKARKGKDEKVAEWIHKIQTLGSQFREAALLNCREGAREGILGMSDRLRNICVIHGLASDRIQTKVRSRNFKKFRRDSRDCPGGRERHIVQQERYRAEGASEFRCSNCGKLSHSSKSVTRVAKWKTE